MTTTFWWVRHAPTHQRTFVGWRDVPADMSDLQTLRWLDTYLPSDALLISSDLIRSVATADAIQSGRQRLAHDPDLREFDFGEWDGLTWQEAAAAHPEVSRTYWEEPGSVAAPGGESWYQAEARVAKAVARLEDAHTGADIIVVAHFGAILSQLRLAHGVRPAEILSQEIDNLSVTRITTDGQTGPINHLP